MNFQKYFKSTALINNPLCGIDTYKDILNLATGETTRRVKKLVLTGSEAEDWSAQAASGGAIRFRYTLVNSIQADTAHLTSICTHLPLGVEGGTWTTANIYTISSNYLWLRLDSSFTTTSELKIWLASEYANGTPLTIWYVLETSETEQITVPSGLSGTVEGYLTQSGTPTPTDPIYPVANDAVGWYGIKNYVRATTWQDGSTYSRSGGSWSSSLTKKRSRKRK